METPLTDAFCQQNELNEPQRQLLAAFDEVDNFWAEKAKEEEASQKSVNEGGQNLNHQSPADTEANAEAYDPNPLRSLTPVRDMSQLMKNPLLRFNPRRLWGSLWYEGEVCCMFAESNVGKSVYAVQIAREIAKTEPVLYYDLELSDSQFVQRYRDADTGEVLPFPGNFYRGTIDETITYEGNREEEMLVGMGKEMLRVGAKVLIIDNLTMLSQALESGEAAAKLMVDLKSLATKLGWSILLVAHTKKRDLDQPITQNDLAGSKRIFNLCDAAFILDAVRTDPGLTYVKQLKVRTGQFVYKTNVLVMEMVKDGSNLHFRKVDVMAEELVLKKPRTNRLLDVNLARKVKSMVQQGMSQRAIARELKISQSSVCQLNKLATQSA